MGVGQTQGMSSWLMDHGVYNRQEAGKPGDRHSLSRWQSFFPLESEAAHLPSCERKQDQDLRHSCCSGTHSYDPKAQGPVAGGSGGGGREAPGPGSHQTVACCPRLPRHKWLHKTVNPPELKAPQRLTPFPSETNGLCIACFQTGESTCSSSLKISHSGPPCPGCWRRQRPSQDSKQE